MWDLVLQVRVVQIGAVVLQACNKKRLRFHRPRPARITRQSSRPYFNWSAWSALHPPKKKKKKQNTSKWQLVEQQHYFGAGPRLIFE